MPNYGEGKGERKRARAQASQQRRQNNAAREKRLSECPSSQNDAAARWDAFYQTKPSLFKDRHILRQAFPRLVGSEVAANPKRHVPPLETVTFASEHFSGLSPQSSRSLSEKARNARERGCDLVLLEAGCGGGNGVFPVLRANPRLFAIAFDFSKEAISVVQANPEHRSGRIHAFQADMTAPDSFLDTLRLASSRGADFVTAFWTLSALPSSMHQTAVNGLVAALVHGGTLFFRDYAVGDMREHKFLASGKQVKDDTSGRLFLRGDGTYAYFFDKDELQSLLEGAGLLCENCVYEERIVENRKQNIVMRRRWIQASFRKPASTTLQ